MRGRSRKPKLPRTLKPYCRKGINGGDCTLGNGNTAEELEAIAVGLLRAAQVVRKEEFGLESRLISLNTMN